MGLVGRSCRRNGPVPYIAQYTQSDGLPAHFRKLNPLRDPSSTSSPGFGFGRGFGGFQIMEENLVHNENVEEEEEYVLLNLDEVRGQVDIPPNAPYVLSGLDTLNPILVIGDNLKLIGEYEETIGTCLVFSEGEATPVVHEETGPSEANLFSGKFIIDPNQAPAKEVKPIASLQKILKFRLLQEGDVQDATSEPADI